MELRAISNRTLNQSTSSTEQANKTKLETDSVYAGLGSSSAAQIIDPPILELQAPSPYLLLKQAAAISMPEQANPFIVLPFEVMLNILTLLPTWQPISNLFKTCTQLNQQFSKVVEQNVSDYVKTKRKNLTPEPAVPRVLHSQAGANYVKNKILDCGPRTILCMKDGQIQPKEAKEQYAQTEVDLRAYLKTQTSLKLSDEQFAALKKYSGDGFFSVAQFQQLSSDDKQRFIRLLTKASIQGYIDSYALLDKVDVTQPPDISKFLVLLRILNKKLVQNMLNKGVIKMTDVTNATFAGVNALRNRGVLELCNNHITTKQQVLLFSELTAKVLCDPGVQDRIKDWAREGEYYVRGIFHAREVVLHNLLKPSVRSVIYDFRSDTSGYLITLTEFLALNDDGQRLLGQRSTMQLFDFISLDYDNPIGKKALFEYWHVLQGQVWAKHVYGYTREELRQLLDEGKYQDYVSKIRAIAAAEAENDSECIIS